MEKPKEVFRGDKDTYTAPVFLMANYCEDNQKLSFLKEAIDGIFLQSNPFWYLIIVDDFSPYKKCKVFLESLQKKDHRVILHFSPENKGPGYCRNIGIKLAKKLRSPFILFNDADDISHNNRLARTTELFRKDNKIGLIYSTFKVIDEKRIFRNENEISQPIKDILDSHKNPPQGPQAWIDAGIRYGYVNLTSSTSVRTSLACKHLFPNARFSEDTHAWYRILADAEDVIFEPCIPTLYRIPSGCKNGTSTRDRLGEEYYYKVKEKMDTEGFKKAIQIAIKRRKITDEEGNNLFLQFSKKLKEIMSHEKYE